MKCERCERLENIIRAMVTCKNTFIQTVNPTEQPSFCYCRLCGEPSGVDHVIKHKDNCVFKMAIDELYTKETKC